MTEAVPFQFETSKRARYNEMFNEEGADKERNEYKPLCQVLKENFSLRPDNDEKDVANINYMLHASSAAPRPRMTVVNAPKLATDERGRMKADFEVKPQEHSTPNFKARALNKRILEQAERLPEVEKRQRTTIAEFSLSKTNLTPRVSEGPKPFKALPLNKKILIEKLHQIEKKSSGRTTMSGEGPKILTLRTDERAKSRARSSSQVPERRHGTVFKARDMPSYNFFEPTKAIEGAEKRIKVEQFNL